MERVVALHDFSLQLQRSQHFSSVQVKDDRYILLHTDVGELVVIYFIDSRLSAQALQQALRDNTLRGIYSLFVLDSGLVPAPGEKCMLSPFMNMMQTLYHGLVYAYAEVEQAIEVFPISIRSAGDGTTAKCAFYGTAVDPTELSCGHIEMGFPVRGFWGTVNFKTQVDYTGFNAQQRSSFSNTYRQQAQHQQRQQRQHRSTEQDAFERLNGLSKGGARQEHYTVLGLTLNATEAQVRAAYRRLARQYHPDLNPAPEAKHRMQEINLAYKVLMQQFN